MDKAKQWIALTVVGVLAVLAAGWFLLVSPKRTDATDLRAQAESAERTTAGLRIQLDALKAQAKTLPQVQAKLEKVAAKIPDNPALPALIRALSTAADAAGVELVSLAPGAPVAVAVAAPAAAPTAVSDAAASSTSGKAPQPHPAGAAALPAAGAAAAGALTSIPVSLMVVGGYYQIEQFFDQVENLSRAMKVTTFNMGKGSNPLKPNTGAPDDGRTLQATISANVYMALGRLVTAPAAPVK